MTQVDVWWARLEDYSAGLDRLLSTVEVGRAARLRRPEDRVRQVLGATMLRLAVGAATGTPPAAVTVERTCPRCAEPHGRPALPGTGLHASITHSGDLVGLALTTVAPVGLDVERIATVDVAGLGRTVLHETERATPPDLPDFFTYWTRKEAVVKATGDGLAASLAEVRVTGPAEPPGLLAYPGRAQLLAHLTDLHPDGGYRAALAVLTAEPVPVDERSGRLLLQ
ncbi:4'-phosphopantetheinyl transferase family protein [Virgisporangium aurantiacum]|uniref:4'-phosphopantetheinyl transferase n=1 Tax=Virgisporangium aurantiacum TaxID=175570 RepID=A0A8J3ZEZ0_9ACTN|nr:4'-phosphopantetheinyl transferase superfamily protein [Virgisporangium aurantiacum]GIJ60555.1 4'-phosphopantetheinyl transferase [Virgisporangium aurantiacum]